MRDVCAFNQINAGSDGESSDDGADRHGRVVNPVRQLITLTLRYAPSRHERLQRDAFSIGHSSSLNRVRGPARAILVFSPVPFMGLADIFNRRWKVVHQAISYVLSHLINPQYNILHIYRTELNRQQPRKTVLIYLNTQNERLCVDYFNSVNFLVDNEPQVRLTAVESIYQQRALSSPAHIRRQINRQQTLANIVDALTRGARVTHADSDEYAGFARPLMCNYVLRNRHCSHNSNNICRQTILFMNRRRRGRGRGRGSYRGRGRGGYNNGNNNNNNNNNNKDKNKDKK